MHCQHETSSESYRPIKKDTLWFRLGDFVGLRLHMHRLQGVLYRKALRAQGFTPLF